MEVYNDKTQVVKLYFELGRILKGFVRKTFYDSGLTMSQSLVVGVLLENNEMKITDLSEALNLSNSTVSGIIDRLEKQNYVVRTRNEEDRRTVRVKLTEKMKEMHEARHRTVQNYFEQLLSPATEEEMGKIIEGLEILKEIVTKRKECKDVKTI